jgi:putative transposase
VPDKSAVPGASIVVLTYGNFLNFNPHLHAIVSDGCFQGGCDFHMAPGFMLEDLGEPVNDPQFPHQYNTPKKTR